MVGNQPAAEDHFCETSVEINTHGGIAVTNEILQLVIVKALRWHLNLGEFTKRAFLNGRVDLTQAEASWTVIALRPARPPFVAAITDGSLSALINNSRQRSPRTIWSRESAIDYPNDDV